MKGWKFWPNTGSAESHMVTGRIRLTNHSILPQNFRMEWVALLNPIDRQGGMVAVPAGPTHVLAGETAYLYPVVFLTGGPQPGTALTRPWHWISSCTRATCASSPGLPPHCAVYEESLEAARSTTARPWEAELARVEMINLSQAVQIETGNPIGMPPLR